MKNIRLSIAVAFAASALGGGVVLGQLSGQQTESIEIPIGQIFEIQAAVPAGSEASWILTQNGDMIESSRELFFRTRISREGDYVLAAEVAGTERVFTLKVRQRRPEDKVISARPNAIVAFNPAMQNEAIQISSDKQVVSITPLREDVQVLALDFDVNVDSNGDGKPGNDEDTKNTLFRSEGNPLHVWFVNASEQTIRLGSLLDGGETNFTNINIQKKSPSSGARTRVVQNGNRPTGTQAQDDNQVERPIESSTNLKILILRNDNGEVEFSLREPAESEKPLLLLWDFGDGSQSMLDRPVHMYAESGKYDVTVEVRDLKTGKVQDAVQDSVMVNRLIEEEDDGAAGGTGETGEDNDDDKKEEPKKEKKKEKKEGSGFLGLVLKLVFSLIGSSILGALIFFFISKVKSRGISLEKAMEKAEETMVKSPESTVAEAAPPMEITAEEVPAEQAAPEPEPEVAAPPAPEPQEPQPPAAPPAPEPAPPVEPPVPPPPAPEPAPAEPPAPAPTSDSGSTPDWLQQGMQQAEAADTPAPPPAPPVEPPPAPPAPEPAPPAPPPAPPAPEPAPAPPPAPEPAPPPPPPPAPEPPVAPSGNVDTPAPNVDHAAMDPSTEQLQADTDNAPAWLQQGMQQAEQTGQSIDAPPPPTLQEESLAPPTEPVAAPAEAATPPTDVSADDAAREEALREKKRKKRQRYRENVKQRKAEENGEAPATTENPDEPVAIIEADVAAPEDPAAPPPPPPPPAPPQDIPPQEPHTEGGQNPA